MEHFHVFVRQEGDATLRVLASDLAEEEIKRQVVKPYRRGTSIVHDGTIVPLTSLRELRICKTGAPFERAYGLEHAAQAKRMDELNREGGVIFLSPGPGYDDMADSFENVTDRFLRGKEPGVAGRLTLLASVTSHPIVSTVLGGVVLAGLVFYLGWK